MAYFIDIGGTIMKKKTGFCASRLLLILIMAGLMIPVLSGCRSDKKDGKKSAGVEVNIPDYCTFVFKGRNAEGKATCDFRSDDLLEALLDHPDRGEFFEDNEDDLEELIESVEVSLTQKSDLSNGDTIPMEVEYDEDLAAELKIDFLNPGAVVTGLEEPEVFDPFEEVEVTFTGVSPYIKVKTNHSMNTPIGYYHLETDKKYYTEGETVILTADCDPEQLLENRFVKVERTQNEYIAHVDYTYLSDVSLFKNSPELFDPIHEQMRDELTNTLTTYEIILYDEFDLDDEFGVQLFGTSADVGGPVTVDSAYLLTINPENYRDFCCATQLVMIYKVPISFPKCPEAGLRYFYFTATLDNLFFDESGSVTGDFETLKTSWYNGRFEGEAYEKLIVGKQDKYQFVEVPIENIPEFPYEVVIGSKDTGETTTGETTAAETTANS